MVLLSKNGIAFILADKPRTGKVEPEFFGQRERTSRGPASLALRSGAPVLPIYLIRRYKGDFRLIIEREITMGRNGNLAADIVENTRLISAHLEALIRRYPDQWNWLTVRMRSDQNADDRRQRQKITARNLACSLRGAESSSSGTRP
jgi:lauroyl/myristoyl acyltransferase